MSEPLNIISLGAGVQSSTMALMIAKGELPYRVHSAVFADTQAEPAGVYRWLDWLEKQLPFPVVRVTVGSLETDTFRVRISKKNGHPYWKNFIPSYSLNPDGSKGMLPRKCTYDFKLVPIWRYLRKLVQPKRLEKRHLANSLLGISIDEAIRMKPSKYAYITNIYPLVDAKISRQGCLEWMKKNGYPMPPRSACVFCPYHSNAEWVRLKTQEPEEFERAVQFERKMWETAADRNVRGREFLHASRVPLDQVAFVDASQKKLNSDGFGNECEGMCGV